MDIIVTTPKTEMENSAKEAENCIKNGGGYYFRRFVEKPKRLEIGDKVFYVEDGFIRGFAIVEKIISGQMLCETTQRLWPHGDYIFMPAESWKWIKPIPFKGFQGYRYFNNNLIEIVGDWKDKKPEIN